MFKFLGKNAVKGGIEELGNSGEAIVRAITKAGIVIYNHTVVPPLIIKFLGDVPELWENLPQEKKQALFNALIAAATKAAVSYAESGGKVKF